MFPCQRYIPAWTHDVISHSSVAKQQQYILFMVLYIAYSDAGQFIACMCQISLVYVSLRKIYESTLSYFWLTLVYSKCYLDYGKVAYVEKKDQAVHWSLARSFTACPNLLFHKARSNSTWIYEMCWYKWATPVFTQKLWGLIILYICYITHGTDTNRLTILW